MCHSDMFLRAAVPSCLNCWCVLHGHVGTKGSHWSPVFERERGEEERVRGREEERRREERRRGGERREERGERSEERGEREECARGTSVADACSSTARLLQSSSQAEKYLSSSSCGTSAVLSRDCLQRSCGETACPCRNVSTNRSWMRQCL